MTKISRYFGLGVAAVLFAAVLAGSGAPASAQGREERCRDYARDAVDQAEQNDRNRCGYEGPRWSNQRGGHYAWCLLFPRQAEDEGRARTQDLRKCTDDKRGGGGSDDRRGGGGSDDRRSGGGNDDRRGGGAGGNREGKRASCDTYSKIAGVQADANDKFNCGFRGGEWSNNVRGHYEWCLTNKREFMIDEIRYRSQELQKCFNNLGDYDDDRYDRNYRRRF